MVGLSQPACEVIEVGALLMSCRVHSDAQLACGAGGMAGQATAARRIKLLARIALCLAGPKTLCNACGVRYGRQKHKAMKKGGAVPTGRGGRGKGGGSGSGHKGSGSRKVREDVRLPH
jgi:hypothetical protein